MKPTPSPIRHQGQCLCGAVRFSFTGEPLSCYACHCSDCLRRTGCAFALSLPIRREQLQLEAGQPEAYGAQLPDGRSKQPWVVIPPGVACFDRQPASAAELIALWKARPISGRTAVPGNTA